MDGMTALLPAPTNIAEQMPQLSGWLRQIAGDLGQEHVNGLVRNTVRMMSCYQSGDWRGFKTLERSGSGFVIGWIEAGFQFGLLQQQIDDWGLQHGKA